MSDIQILREDVSRMRRIMGLSESDNLKVELQLETLMIESNPGKPLAALLDNILGNATTRKEIGGLVDDLVSGPIPIISPNRLNPQTKMKYQIRNGEGLLSAYRLGHLTDDEAEELLKTLFKNTDDYELMQGLAKEFIKNDPKFKILYEDGSLDFKKLENAYGKEQAMAIRQELESLYPKVVISKDDSWFQFGKQESLFNKFGNIPNIDQNYVINKLRTMFAGNKKAIDAINKAEPQLKNYIPLNQRDAELIVNQQKELIDQILKQKGFTEELSDQFKKELISGWATKYSIRFFGAIIVSGVFLAIMKVTNMNGLTPIKNIAEGLGLIDWYYGLLAFLCEKNQTWACGLDSKKDKSSGSEFDPEGSN